MTIGIFAGSFDPITYGHSYLIHKASEFCDQLVVAIGINPNKKTLFSLEERIDLIKDVTKDFRDNIVVDSFEGLLVNYVDTLKPIRNPSKLLIRGVRSAADFEYESNLALINKELRPGLETVLLVSSPGTSLISSSMVKELASYDQDIRKFVHPAVVTALLEKIKSG